jgi:hypothetical protein
MLMSCDGATLEDGGAAGPVAVALYSSIRSPRSAVLSVAVCLEADDFGADVLDISAARLLDGRGSADEAARSWMAATI